MSPDQRKVLQHVAEALKEDVCPPDESLIDALADRGVDLRPAMAWKPMPHG